MNRKQLIILGITALVVSLLAVFLSLRESNRYEPTSHVRLYPDLESKLNSITRLVVQQAGQTPVTLKLKDGRWRVAEKSGYPADLGQLRKTLIALAKLELVEAKTRNREKYSQLDVESIDQANAHSQDLKLFGNAGAQLAHVIIGKTDTAGGSYVRKAEEEQSWLGSESISLPSKAVEWLDKPLISLDTQRIQRVEVDWGKSTGYALFRTDPSQLDFQMEGLPQGTRLKPEQARRIASALLNLRLSDVISQKQMPDTAGDWKQVTFKTFDGLIIKAESRDIKEKQYLKLAADYNPEGVKEHSTKNARVNPKQEAAQLQQRFQNWIFIIPSYEANALDLDRDSLLEDVEKTTKPNESKKPSETDSKGASQ
jgi:hypothetical protein